MNLLQSLGFIAVLIGVTLIMVGLFLSRLRAFRGGGTGSVKTAGVVLIGPFPIVFGDKGLVKYSLILLLIFVVLSLVMLFSLPRLM